jgi:hypothetical protein
MYLHPFRLLGLNVELFTLKCHIQVSQLDSCVSNAKFSTSSDETEYSVCCCTVPAMAMAADLGNFVLSFMSDCNTEIIIFICKHKHAFCLTLSPGTEGLPNLLCINVRYMYNLYGGKGGGS